MWLMLAKKLLSKKRKGSRKGAFLFVVGPVIALFSVAIIFFLASDFWVYIQLLFFQKDAQNGVREPYKPPQYSQDTPGGSLKNPLGDEYGDVMVNMAGVDIHIAGYIKEWVEIARDVCNRKIMNPEVTWIKTRDNANPTIALVLGTQITEANLPGTYLPHTGLKAELYQPRRVVKDDKGNITEVSYTGDYNFYRYDSVSGKNSDPYGPAGGPYGDYRLYRNWSTTTFFTTPYQMNYGWAKYYPYFTWTYDNGYRRYPATIDGAHMNDSDTGKYVRDPETGYRIKGESDAVFVPDSIAASVQWYCAQYLMGGYYDASNITMEQYFVCGWPLYNSGWSTPRAYMMAWGTRSPSSPDGQSKKGLTCAGFVKLHDIAMRVGEYYSEHDIVWNMNDPSNYKNHIQMWMVAGGGFFLHSGTYAEFVEKVKAAPDSYIDDYRAGKGNASLTVEQMLADSANWYRKLDAGRYIGCNGQDGIFWLDDSAKINYGGGLVPALHGVGDFDCLRGVFTITVGAPYAYWRILTTAGVVCTRQQAFEDCFGEAKLADLIDTRGASGVGTRIATIAANYALPSTIRGDKYGGSVAWNQASGSATRVAGTALYRKLVSLVKNNGLYSSCDNQVCTAVRAAGADDAYLTTNVNPQLKYLEENSGTKDSKWEEIFWYDATTNKFDYDALQPGDVFIFSSAWETKKVNKYNSKGNYDGNGTGHTYIYCGTEIIDESFGDIAHLPGQFVHASYTEYAPAVGYVHNGGWGYFSSWVGWDRRPYRVFRCINPEDNSVYAGKYEEALAECGITHTPP